MDTIFLVIVIIAALAGCAYLYKRHYDRETERLRRKWGYPKADATLIRIQDSWHVFSEEDKQKIGEILQEQLERDTARRKP